GAKVRQPVVVGARDIARQIYFPRGAKRNAAGRIDDLDVDAVSIHVFELHMWILVRLAKCAAETAVPRVAGPKRPDAVLRPQIFLQAFGRFLHVAVGVDDGERFHFKLLVLGRYGFIYWPTIYRKNHSSPSRRDSAGRPSLEA